MWSNAMEGAFLSSRSFRYNVLKRILVRLYFLRSHYRFFRNSRRVAVWRVVVCLVVSSALYSIEKLQLFLIVIFLYYLCWDIVLTNTLIKIPAAMFRPTSEPIIFLYATIYMINLSILPQFVLNKLCLQKHGVNATFACSVSEVEEVDSDLQKVSIFFPCIFFFF